MHDVFQFCGVVRERIEIQNTDQHSPMKFAHYDPEEFFDEMFARAGAPRAAAHALTQVIDALPPGEIERRQRSAERALMAMGITFNVYGDDEGTERIFPFDLIPRIVSAAEWRTIERGLKQRIHALNLFIDDIYHDREDPQGRRHSEPRARDGQIAAGAVCGAEPAARHLVPRHGDRSGPPLGRPGVRARRQPANAVRRLLRPAEPERDEAHLPAGLRGVTHPAGR